MASMSMRGIAGFLFGLLVVGILVGLGVGVYQAGIAQGIVDAGRYPAGAGVPVAGYGYGWHGGPGIFGILFGIFFLFLVFGLLRAAFFRGRGYGPGWGHRGYGHGWGPGWTRGEGTGQGPEAWRAERDRRMADLHRQLHEEGDLGASGPSVPGGGTPPAR
jgi:hypothetical protein